MDWIPEIIREGILTVLFISGPLVILAASLGLFVGVLQAATQVQEQTLGSAVKIIGLFLALIISGFYIFSYLKRYAEKNISRAFSLIPTLTKHPKPRTSFFVPLKASKKGLKGQPARLDLRKQEAPPTSPPSKIKARPEAATPDLTAGTPDKRNRPLGKPPSQVKPKGLPIQQQKVKEPPKPVAKPATTNQTKTTNSNKAPAIKPELSDLSKQSTTNTTVEPQTPQSQELVAPKADESKFSSLIDKLKKDAEQEIE